MRLLRKPVVVTLLSAVAGGWPAGPSSLIQPEDLGL